MPTATYFLVNLLPYTKLLAAGGASDVNRQGARCVKPVGWSFDNTKKTKKNVGKDFYCCFYSDISVISTDSVH